MICPNEHIEMRPVQVESHYGQRFMLDQCPECGGIWFDHFELYKAKQGEAERIDLLDGDRLRNPSSIENSEILCPRDRTKLIPFKDLLFPKDIIIARCPACSGFWLNRGEFTKYQQYREALKPREVIIKEDNLEPEIERILAEHRAGDSTDMLGKLGSFLSTPMDPITGRPLEPEKLSQTEKSTIDVLTNMLLVIFRLFIRI